MFKRSFGLMFFAILCITLFVGAFAMAAEVVATPTVGDSVSGFLTRSVFPLFAAVVLSLLSILLHKVAAKYKLDFLVQHQDFIEKVAIQGISLAEEKAAQLVKAQVDKRYTGQEKMAIAVQHICDAMPSVTPAQAENIVNSLMARIPGLGATGDKVVAVGDGTTAALQGVAIPAEPPAPVAVPAPAAA